MANEINITPEAQAQAKAAEQTLEIAKSYTIDSQEMMTLAADELQSIKAKLKSLDEQEKAITRPMNDALKAARDWFRAPKQFLSDAEAILKRAMLTYQGEQEKKRRAAEAAAQEIARKERERLAKQAAKAAEKGQTEKAEALETAAATVVTPIVPKYEKPAGISTRENWKAEITDKMELIQAVAAGTLPHEYLIVDMKILNAQAKALKTAFNIAGARAVSEQVLASRSA